MSKVLTKSKNGWKAVSAKQMDLVSVHTCPGPSRVYDQVDRTTGSKGSHAHHKPHSLSKASIKDERCRDHALQKICNKASKHALLGVVSKDEICPSGKELPWNDPLW